jgi:hypothetical protein
MKGVKKIVKIGLFPFWVIELCAENGIIATIERFYKYIQLRQARISIVRMTPKLQEKLRQYLAGALRMTAEAVQRMKE